MNNNPQGNFINNTWHPAQGPILTRHDPTQNQLIFNAPSASPTEVQAAIEAAKQAAPAWSALSTDQRLAHLDNFATALRAHQQDLIETISLETGKPRWESKTEFDSTVNKIQLTKTALAQRLAPVQSTSNGITSRTRYKPFGPVAVLGPFNLPAHLPNGQILPALAAGNTVVFKPSELTPLTGQLYAQCWHEAQLPAGVFNMIQGTRDQGAQLAGHRDIRAVYFTGSRAAGIALSTALASTPEKLLALEMGGNNPLIAADIKPENLDAAALLIVQSAFITAGQRCTCARRLILDNSPASDQLLHRLLTLLPKILIAPYTQTPEPFMGPVISPQAAQKLQAAQHSLLQQGATLLTPTLKTQDSRLTSFLPPTLLDITHIPPANRPDEELFGPILQLIRVNSVEEALTEANRTRYGLAAALLSDNPALFETFHQKINAGIVNINRPTTGASSSLPFGGLNASGNHRPAGFHAIDACADPVASLESPNLNLPATLPPGLSNS